jgi:hypothetical protein
VISFMSRRSSAPLHLGLISLSIETPIATNLQVERKLRTQFNASNREQNDDEGRSNMRILKSERTELVRMDKVDISPVVFVATQTMSTRKA